MNATARISPDQTKAIHVLKGKAGLDDDSYRDLMARETGKRSAKELSAREAGAFMDKLRELSEGGLKAPVKGAVRMSGDYAGKLRALWISGYNLGVVHDRTDKALLSFLEGKVQIARPEWLAPKDGTKAIEGLKAWLAREGGVVWPASASVRAQKVAVYEAICRRLVDATGACNMPLETAKLPLDEIDALMRAGGGKLRRALKGAAR
ncbi:MAG TPA: regulatory protein GemA [Xanthobacteraceae bacterium]|nr:regulatory protein GemA [Xanthobacteraceae bacterium]